jgi:hypothetical protein
MDKVSGRDTGEKERERGREKAGIRRERGEESERLSKNKSLLHFESPTTGKEGA